MLVAQTIPRKYTFLLIWWTTDGYRGFIFSTGVASDQFIQLGRLWAGDCVLLKDMEMAQARFEHATSWL